MKNATETLASTKRSTGGMSGGTREETCQVKRNAEDTVLIINHWEPPTKTARKWHTYRTCDKRD